MMRLLIGSFSLPSSARNRPPAMRVLGAMSVSTTLIHGVHGIEAKYSAVAVLEIVHLLDKVGHRITGDGGVFRAALAVRIVAQGAGAYFGPTAVRDDLRHLRVVARKPVRGTEAVADLCRSEERRVGKE